MNRANEYIRSRFESEIRAAYEWGCVVGAMIVVLACLFFTGVAVAVGYLLLG